MFARLLARGVWGGIVLLLAEASPLPSPFPAAQAFDPAAGKKTFIRCKACHTVEKGGRHLVGPNLWGIVGKKSGTTKDFSYSEAMKRFDKKWDVRTLSAYLTNPKKVVLGTRMVFIGLKDAKQRADVIAYLNSKSDKPIRLNTSFSSVSGETTKKESKTTGSTSGSRRAKAGTSLLPAGVGRDETEAYCSVCHSLQIVVQQGLSREDWDELLVWMVEEQEMPPMETNDRDKVLGYLAKHFNKDRPHFKIQP